MPFTRDQLAAFTGRTLPDLIPHPTRLLIVGINPGLLTVAARLKEGGLALRERVAALGPTVVAILGISAYRIAFDAPAARVGRQDDWGDSQVWVVPNPSGLNAHSTLDDLASAYREVAVAAGIPVRPPVARL